MTRLLIAVFLLAAILLARHNVASAAMMEVRARVTDLAGNDVSSISVGQQFKLQTIVTDVRNPPASQPRFQGVFSAGNDIYYNSALSSIDTAQAAEFGSFFNLVRSASLSQGYVTGYGAGSSLNGPGNAPQFLFSVVLTATSAGTQTFTSVLHEEIDHDYNLYTFNPPFPLEEIDFIGDTLEIVPEPTTYALAGLGAAALLFAGRRRGCGVLGTRLC